MRALFIVGMLVLTGIVLVNPAVADRGGHWGGHFGGGHFHHFGHPRVFIGGYFGYPYYSYPYWYSPYPYAYPYPYPYEYPYGYPTYPPPGASAQPNAVPQPPAGGMSGQSGGPGQGF